MGCALEIALGQGLDNPDNRQVLEELLERFRNDPQYFRYLRSSLEFSLPKILGFNVQIVRSTCDKCALNPLEECNFADILNTALQQRTGNHSETA